MTSVLETTNPEHWEVQQVIALDWYDGPRAGFCRLRSPPIDFHFQLLAERPTREGLDDRLFRISILAPGALDEVLASLSFAGPPAQPLWVPRWESTDGSDIQLANAAVDRAIQGSGTSNLIVRTSDFERFLGSWNVELSAEAPDWFAALGIAVDSQSN